MLKILMKLAGAVMILAAIASCKKDEKEDFGVPSIGVSTNSVSFSEAEGRQTVKILSSRDWTADITFTEEVEEPWLVVSPASGSASNDSVDVVFSVLANSAEDRYATVTFNAGAVSATVSVSQKGEIAKEYDPISGVRELYQGENVTITEDWTICGTVISNYRHANSGGLNNATSQKTVIIQDETAGISLYLAENNTDYALGDRIEVKVKDLTLQRFQDGSLQISDVPMANITKLTAGQQVEPKAITAAELVTGDYESQYVAVSDVQIMESDLGSTFVTAGSDGEKRHTSINFIAKTGERFVLFSSSYSTFGDELVPEGSGTLKGIAAVYGGSTYQISITSTDDYAGLTGERFDVSDIPTDGKMIGDYNTWSKVGPLASFADDFSSVSASNQEYINDNWLFWTNDGGNVNYGFKTGTFNNDADKYIQIAPYDATVDEVVAFALPPRADMVNADPRQFTFSKALYYQTPDDSKMEVVVSTDFAGDFESATWTVVKDVTFPEDASINEWVDETVDLSSYSGQSSLCIALRYTGKANTYRIDNVAFGDGEIDNPDPDPNPDEPIVATVAEVLAAEVDGNVWYQMTGTIQNIENTAYGNFTLVDETGSIYVYGLTAEKVDKNDQSFSTLGLNEGDIVTLVGTRDEFGGEAQVGGPAYYISHEDGGGEDPDPDEPGDLVEVTIAEFLAASESSDVWYQLTGKITSIDNEYYGNITIEDNTGSVYVYGLTKTKVDKNDNSFSSIGLSEGDIVTLAGTRTSYNDQPQVGGPAYYISHEEGELPDDPALIEGTAGDGVYEGNIDLSQPSAVSTDDKCVASTFVIDGEEYIGMKLGASKAAGSYSFNLGMTGSATLTMYAVAWNNNKTHAKVKISGGGTINGFSEVELDCQTNAGLSGNEPFTIEFGSNDFYTMNIEGATSSTVITVTTEGMSKTRVGFLGVNVK